MRTLTYKGLEMFNLHRTTSKSLLATTGKLFRRPTAHAFLAPERLNAHMLRDIGVNPVGID